MPMTDENRGRRTFDSCHVARTTPGRLAPLMALVSLAAVLVGVNGYLGAERAGTVHVSATVIAHEYDRSLARSLAESEWEIQAGKESRLHGVTDASAYDHGQDGAAADSEESRDGERRARFLRCTSFAFFCGGVGDGWRIEEQTGVASGDVDDSAMVQKFYLKRNGVRYRMLKPKTKAGKRVKAKAELLPSADTVEKMRRAKQADAADPPMKRCSSKFIGKLSCGRWLSQAELKENFETCRSCRSLTHKNIESRPAGSHDGMPGAHHGMSEAGYSQEPVDDSSFGHAVAEEHEEFGEESEEAQDEFGEESEEEDAHEEFGEEPDDVD